MTHKDSTQRHLEWAADVSKRKKNIRQACVCSVSFVRLPHFLFFFFFNYQKLGGAQKVQGEGLDPGAVDAQLSVDARALNAGENA